jgi:hypothetical protein
MTMTATLQSRRNMRRYHPVWRCYERNCPQEPPIRTTGNFDIYTRKVEEGYRQFWRDYCASKAAEQQ